MIYSMTAFARLELKQSWGNAVWEIRSVNQRYLENFFRLPEQFRGLENSLREKLRQRITRGKVECNLRLELSNQTAVELQLNQELAQQVLKSLQWLKQQCNDGEINLTDVLRYPGVVATPEQDLDQIGQDLLSGFDHLLDDFIAMRERCGAHAGSSWRTGKARGQGIHRGGRLLGCAVGRCYPRPRPRDGKTIPGWLCRRFA